jgi:putative transcriptional regulator
MTKKILKKKPAPTAADRRLMQATREILADHRGETVLTSYIVDVPQRIDVASVRKKLGYSQKQFADHFGFALSALKEWEQGRRKPERSTRVYLAVIESNPQLIEQTLAQM